MQNQLDQSSEVNNKPNSARNVKVEKKQRAVFQLFNPNEAIVPIPIKK